MQTATQNISIRLTVIGGNDSRKQITLTGEAAVQAMQRIKDSTAPASRSLLAVNVAGEQLRYGLENLSGGAGTLGLSLARLGPVGLAAAAILGSLGLAAAGAIREFKEAEQATNLLTAALQTTGNAAGVTVKQIQQIGEAVEETTLFKKEEVLSAAAALTSYGNIQEDVFKRALVLSTDLATRLGGDVASAADLLGAALENPEKGLGRLDRKFQDLDEAQKEAITNFIKVGDVASAQAVILSHLEDKSRTLAESQAQGLTGAANKLGDAWDNLLESLGNTINESGAAQASLSALTFIVERLNKAVDNSLPTQKRRLEEEIKGLTGSFGTRLDELVLGSAPGLEAKKRELAEVNRKIAEEARKDAERDAESAKAADLKRATDRNNDLLAIEKEYQKKFKDATLSEREKILEEAKLTKENIDKLFKDDRNSAAAERARAAVDANLKAQLAKLDRPAIEQRAQQSDAARKRAIEEINRGILQTKPSFDVAKQALDDWKAKLIEDLGGASAENQKYIDLIEQIYNVKLKDIYYKSLLDSKKWEDGASRALKRYADEATDAAKNSERVFTNAATKIEDALVDALSSGEFSLKKLGDLIQDIEKDILRSFIRQNITGPIADGLGSILGGGGGGSSGGGGIFGNLFSSIFGSSSSGSSGGGFFSGIGSFFSSLFHEGGVVGETLAGRRAVPAHAFIGARRFHNGLMPDEFPAILQKGETVLPKNTRMGGNNIVFNITTPNAQSFMDSRGQIMAKFAGEMQRSRTRNS